MLRRISFRESSLIVHVLTQNSGVISLLAKGGRRAKSPFCATLEPLHILNLEYKEARTDNMGLLLKADRQTALLQHISQYSLGLKYTAIASSLLRHDHEQALQAYLQGIYLLAARPENYALVCGVWHLLKYCGWIGSLEQCWQCGQMIDNDNSSANKHMMFWHTAQLHCYNCHSYCVGMHTKKIDYGLRRSITTTIMSSANVRLHDRYVSLWNSMADDVLRLHGVKNTLIDYDY